jgi:hypothetical protein
VWLPAWLPLAQRLAPRRPVLVVAMLTASAVQGMAGKAGSVSPQATGPDCPQARPAVYGPGWQG